MKPPEQSTALAQDLLIVLGMLVLVTPLFVGIFFVVKAGPQYAGAPVPLDCRGMGTYTFYGGAAFPAPGQYSIDEAGRIIVGTTSPTSTPYAIYITPAQLPSYTAQGYTLVSSTTEDIAYCYDLQDVFYTATVTPQEAFDYRHNNQKPAKTTGNANPHANPNALSAIPH